MANKKSNPPELFSGIAKEFLHIETLETRNSDRLDFTEVSVWGVKSALEAAYAKGVMRGITIEKQKRRKLEK